MSHVPSVLSGARRRVLAAVILSTVAVGLAGCAAATPAAEAGASTISVETNTGTVEVPATPTRVAALDNTSFVTLKALGVTPVAVPKPLLPASGFESWSADPILDAGSHREPDLEAVSEAAPDLIIGGSRFESHQKDLEKIAPTIDIAPSDTAKDGYLAGLTKQTATLGAIFGQQEKAKKIIAAFEAAHTKAAASATGQSVFLAVVSGGHIDNGASRIGRLLDGVDLVNVLSADNQSSTAVHNDSGLAPETIAQLDPEWVIVLDRDAATADDATPAKELIESNEAFANTTFLTRGNVVYLASSFYLDEGIQAYTTAFTQLAAALDS
ncbi:ABC transporter substrate-binding protein [Leifsonia lichenia]